MWPGVQYATGQSFDLGRIARVDREITDRPTAPHLGELYSRLDVELTQGGDDRVTIRARLSGAGS